MPNTIDLVVDQGSNLDWTLQRALNVLRAKGVKTLSAAQIVSASTSALGRILLVDPADKVRAIRILEDAKFLIAVQVGPSGDGL